MLRRFTLCSPRNFQEINILSILVKIASQTIAHFKSENLKRKLTSLTMITFASELVFDCKVRRQETSYRSLFERRMYLEIYFEVLELHLNR